MPQNSCIMQIWAEPEKSALPICNYSQILYQFLMFTQNLKRSPMYQKNIPAESCINMLDEDADFVNHIYQLCQFHPDWNDSNLFDAVESN